MSSAEHDRRVDYIEFSVKSVADAERFLRKRVRLELRGLWAGLRQLCRWPVDRWLSGNSAVKPGPLVVVYAADLKLLEQRVQAGWRRHRAPELQLSGRPAVSLHRSQRQ